MAETKTYFIDESGSCVQRTVTMTLGDCTTVEQYTQGNGESYVRKEIEITFSITSVLDEDLEISYRIEKEEYDDFSGSGQVNWIDRTATIEAGDVNVVVVEDCLIETYEDYGSGGLALFYEEITQYELLAQTTIPETCIDPLCDIEITDVSVTNPELRGQTGSIEVTVSGNTGNISYYLNGILYDTNPSTTYTFSDVESGTHTVLVVDEADCQAQETGVVIVDGDFRTKDLNISTPPILQAAHNPIIYNVRTNQSSDVIQKASARIRVKDERIEDGARIVFNFTNPSIYNVTFYARTFPNRNNFFLATDITDINNVVQGVNTREEITQSIGEVLFNDNFISQNYNIYVTGHDIVLTAKQTGSKFNINSSNVFIRDEDGLGTTDYFSLIDIRDGLDRYDGEIIDNYSLYCEVFLNKNTNIQYPVAGSEIDYEKVSELNIPFQLNNKHIFNISDIVSSYVNTPKPFYEFSGYTVLPDMIRPYYIRFGESYPIVSNSNTVKRRFKESTDVRWVVNSALNRYVANDMSVYEGEPISYLNPDFTITQNSQDLIIEDVIDPANSGNTTSIVYQLKDASGNVVRVYQSSNIFTSVATDNYIVEVRGNTDGINYSVEKRFRMSGAPSLPIAKKEVITIPTYNGKFLTNSPNPKQIQRQQNEYLYFIMRKNFGYPIVLRGDIYYYDGTNDLDQTFFTITTTNRNAGGVFVLNLSYDKLGLDSYEDQGGLIKKIKYVDVRVEYELNGSWINMSEKKRYAFAINEQPRKFGILFENALGGYDTYDFIGIVEKTIERTSGEFNIVNTPDIFGRQQQGFKRTVVYDTRITKRVTANTGWINREHLNWLQELINSNNIYDYSEDNQHYLKIIDYSYIESSQEDLFDLEVIFEYTVYENNVKV